MQALVIANVAIFIWLCLAEILWRRKILKGEYSRKFVHIAVGVFVAFWPYMMPWHYIVAESVALLTIIVISRIFHIFRSIHASVNRKTWGDIMFPVGIGIVAVASPAKWIFVAAVLNMSLADGIAAIVGKKFGTDNQYKILGFTKSIAGTMAFWLTSLATLIALFILNDISLVQNARLLFWLPLATAGVENIGVYGLDNFFVPTFIMVVLGTSI